jgi:hypothetical protein
MVTVVDTQPIVRTPFDERLGSLSPDGRHLAYRSNESGRFEVYVVSFPGGNGKRQVSSAGGTQPQWNPQDGELFYWETQVRNPQGGEQTLMAVSVDTKGVLLSGRPRKLFEPPQGVIGSAYSVSSEGKRFLMVQQNEAGEQPQTIITVVENWISEFQVRE